MGKQLGVRVSEGLYDAVEVRRRELGQSRVLFVQRALEAALGAHPGRLESSGTPDAGSSSARGDNAPASPRASDAYYGALKRAPYVKPFRPQPKS